MLVNYGIPNLCRGKESKAELARDDDKSVYPAISADHLTSRMPVQTEAEFFTDSTGRRWFRTGDIGQVV